MKSECLFYKKQKLLLSSCVTFLLVHLYKFTNYLPNWDSMYGMKLGKLGMTAFGRWFSGIAEILTSSRYDLQWVSGIVCSIFVGATIVIVLDLLSIDKKYLQAILILLFAAFPSMAATLNYSLWASAYMLGLFLSVLGVYICVKYTKYFYLSIPCFTLSMGIYQIYILFAGVCMIYYFADLLLNPDEKIGNHRHHILASVLSFVSSGVLYLLIDRVWRAFFHIELGSYQGIATAGKMSLKAILIGFTHMAVTAVRFFLPSNEHTFYNILNISIILFIIVVVLWKIIFNRNYSVARRIVLCAMFASAIPITYSFYLVSEGVEYHKLMELGVYFIYLIPILILNHNDFELKSKSIPAIIMILIGTLGIYHFVNDNVSYHQLNMSYERTFFQMTETLMKVDSVNENDCKKIAVIGRFPYVFDGIGTYPDITGAATSSFIHSQFHFVSFAKYYMNREYIECTGDECQEIEKSSRYAEMSEYPYGDYVDIINDIVVVKLS